MKKSKKTTMEKMAQEVENNMCKCGEHCDCNDGQMGNIPMRAGALVNVFSQLDPDTKVYTMGDGHFAVAASENDVNNLAAAYAPEAIDNPVLSNPYPVEDRFAGEVYGDDVRLGAYDTGDFQTDTENMDYDFAEYIADTLMHQEQLISSIIKGTNDRILDNLCNYQNTKNKRTKVEVARVVNSVVEF